jgi:glucose-1-phosphatase
VEIKGNQDKRIKNIIFDLGGVLLNINYHLTSQAFKELGIKNFDELYSQAKQSSLFVDFERGQISPDDFRSNLRSIINVQPFELDKAWNAMLLDFPEDRIKVLQKLSENYRLFLLSNTNEIHIKWYSDYLFKTFGFRDLSHLMEKEYYSYKVGLSKPDPSIFELVLKENDLAVSETLYIDDSIQHIEAAQKLGLDAIHLTPPQTILDIFTDN